MTFVDTLTTLVKERRVGFLMDEIMTGTHRFVDGKGPSGEHPMEFRATWGNKNFSKWVNPFGGEFLHNTLCGKVDVGGLVVDAHCRGTLELRYFQDQKIIYTFEFADEQGKQYKYVGMKKDLRPWNLHRTHTTCYGSITDLDTGEVISNGIVYFRISTALPFVMSFRLA